MSWRSLIVTRNSHVKIKSGQIRIEQGDDEFSIPIEDVAVIVIDSLEATITSKLLSACVDQKIVVAIVDETHMPNGLLLPYMSHSRQLKAIELQLAVTKPVKKRLWQHIVKAKLVNQAESLKRSGKLTSSKRLLRLVEKVKSGDPENCEAQAAQVYFPARFSDSFVRNDQRFYNSAINYGYAVVRSAIARGLVIYGLLPVWGVNHHSQLNAFNLADDLLEPFRALVDDWVVNHWPEEPSQELTRDQKSILVSVLASEVKIGGKQMNILHAAKETSKSLVNVYRRPETSQLLLPEFLDEHN